MFRLGDKSKAISYLLKRLKTGVGDPVFDKNVARGYYRLVLMEKAVRNANQARRFASAAYLSAQKCGLCVNDVARLYAAFQEMSPAGVSDAKNELAAEFAQETQGMSADEVDVYRENGVASHISTYDSENLAHIDI